MTFGNRDKLVARLNRIPKAVQEAAEDALKKEVDDLVAAMQRAAPVGNPAEGAEPGKFRDSIHAYENPDKPLSYRILADARDEQGRFIGAHIEFGHKAPDGSHVAASPSFFPTYRARKRAMRRRLSAATRKAFKQVAANASE